MNIATRVNGHSIDAAFSAATLSLDPAAEVERIAQSMREHIQKHLRRQGAVVGLSGGIDSSVTAALCVRAFGPERVFGLHMPERASAPETIELSPRTALMGRNRPA